MFLRTSMADRDLVPWPEGGSRSGRRWWLVALGIVPVVIVVAGLLRFGVPW